MGDRAGEAATLNNMAVVYRTTGELAKALALYEQVLPIMRQVGDRAGEAATLNNMAMVYRFRGEPLQALALYEQALPITRQVGDRAGEATTLNNIGDIYIHKGELHQSVEMLKQAILIAREIRNIAQEAAIMYNLAGVLSQLEQFDKAVELVRGSIDLLKKNNLPQDTYGATIAHHEQLLRRIKTRKIPSSSQHTRSSLSDHHVHTIVRTTIGVMTINPENREEWRGILHKYLMIAEERDDKEEAELFIALNAILDGSEVPTLTDEHPYAKVLETVTEGIADGGAGLLQQFAQEAEMVMAAIRAYLDAVDLQAKRQVIEEHQEVLFRPEASALFKANIEQARKEGDQETEQMLVYHWGLLNACKQEGIETAFDQMDQSVTSAVDDAEQTESLVGSLPDGFVERCVSGINGDPQEKQDAFNYLVKLAARHPKAGNLIKDAQLAIMGQNLATLGQDLSEEHAEIWRRILETISNK